MKQSQAEAIIKQSFNLSELADGSRTCPCGEWSRLWQRYSEVMASVGDCPFTEAVELIDEAY